MKKTLLGLGSKPIYYGNISSNKFNKTETKCDMKNKIGVIADDATVGPGLLFFWCYKMI